MSVGQVHVGSSKAIAFLPFGALDIPDANGTLYFLPDANGNGTLLSYPMPYGGSIIGLAGTLNAQHTGGTLSFQAVIDGSLTPIFAPDATTHANRLGFAFNQDGRKSNYEFNANQRIGLMWSKEGTVAPTTADLTMTLVVLLEGVKY